MRTSDTDSVNDVTASRSGADPQTTRGVKPGTVRLARSLAFGEPDRTTPDPGLFGPDSISWRVHSDVIAGVGGLRAVLMQGLLPDAVSSIVAHSNYKDDPWGRLFRTAEYIGVITYGTSVEAERAAAAVRGIHRRLQLDDPAWLMWVHASFTDSLLTTAQRSGVRLTASEADQYVAEQQTAARLVGLDPTTAPDSVAALNAYVDDMRPTLGANKTARDIARFVLVPPMPLKTRLLTPARPAWAGVAATAFALLPAWARRMYGGPLLGLPVIGTAVADGQATIAVRALRHGLLALPESARTGPHVAAANARLGLSG
jgi:uncharacterized protein (DUF2236 family)